MKESFSKKDTLVIKGIAILFLLYHHCFLRSARYKNLDVIFSPLNESQAHYLAAFLKICVGMFVFLTAYGITISLKNKYNSLSITNKDAVLYIKHRVFNLYSSWIFVFIFCELFGFFYSRLPLDVYGKGINGLFNFALDGLGIANLFGTPTLVGTWWYMSLAITLILVTPILIKVYNKIGFVYLSLLFVILCRQLNITDSSLVHWTPAVILGIVCADKNILVKMSNFKIIKHSDLLNKLFKFITGFIIILMLIKFRQSSLSAVLFEIKDGFIPFFFIYFCYEFISGIKYINYILSFIGKHSMNIFLVHTFIRANFFRKFVYSFRYSFLIILVLLIISLFVSIIIELLKKYSGYNKMITFLKNKYKCL